MEGRILENQSLANFCTFGTGGNARYLTKVTTADEMELAFLFAKEKKIPYVIIGKGSNCLFDDRGFIGLVIVNHIQFCQIRGAKLYVGSGYSFSRLGQMSVQRDLSGLEFATCIPGTLGGAVFMNAGANGKEIKDLLEEVYYLNDQGKRKIFQKKDLKFSYRFSSFQRMRGAIISASLYLTFSKYANKFHKLILEKRAKTQPLEAKSAGSVFRNPSEGLQAGALIEQCGLKGFQIGGAKISKKHANFIINKNEATSSDILKLIDHVQQKVKQKTNVLLIPEVRYISCYGF